MLFYLATPMTHITAVARDKSQRLATNDTCTSISVASALGYIRHSPTVDGQGCVDASYFSSVSIAVNICAVYFGSHTLAICHFDVFMFVLHICD